jgi:hypothetical protein
MAALQTEAVIQASDPNWLNIQASIIDLAEQRCYRDLDLLATVVRDTSSTLTANSRDFTLPQSLGRFVTVQELAYFTGAYPAGRTLLLPLPRSVINTLFPSETGSAAPQYYAPITDQIFIIAPAPTNPYTVEVTGTIRPAPLSASNTTTFLSNYCSDLLFAACMVAVAGYLQNFGSQADNPKLALSWDQEYQNRLASLKIEELKRKYSFGDWVSQ